LAGVNLIERNDRRPRRSSALRCIGAAWRRILESRAASGEPGETPASSGEFHNEAATGKRFAATWREMRQEARRRASPPFRGWKLLQNGPLSGVIFRNRDGEGEGRKLIFILFRSDELARKLLPRGEFISHRNTSVMSHERSICETTNKIV